MPDPATHSLLRSTLDTTPGSVLVEVGATWCGHCQALEPILTRLLADHPSVRHVRVEDGPGRPLGRSFQVKLWPTLILLRDGQVVNRLVRPSEAAVRAGLDALDHDAPRGL